MNATQFSLFNNYSYSAQHIFTYLLTIAHYTTERIAGAFTKSNGIFISIALSYCLIYLVFHVSTFWLETAYSGPF